MKTLLVGYKAADLTPELLEGDVTCHVLDIYHRHDIDGLVHLEIHVIEKNCSALYHLESGQLTSKTDVLRSESILIWPYILAEPLEKRHIVGVSAQQGHGCMGMAVIERRQDRLSGSIYHLCSGESLAFYASNIRRNRLN